MTDEQTTTNERQSFPEWLAAQRRGALSDELTAALGELVERVTILGRKGSLTLKLEVKPHAAGVVIVTDDISTRPPKEDRPGAIWFVDNNYDLTRHDPLQTSLADLVTPEVSTDDK